jgi:hypothetical protein
MRFMITTPSLVGFVEGEGYAKRPRGDDESAIADV